MRHDAIVFDIDGTLWDVSAATAGGWSCGLAKLGIDREVSAEEVRSVAGNPLDRCMDILFPGLRVKNPSLRPVLEDCEKEAIMSSGGGFFDGVIEGIRELAGKYRIFLVSNCQDWYLDLFLDFSGLKPVLTGSDCNGLSGLPKNEMLSRIKSSYSLDNPVYIGDTAGDETAARLAGMEFIHAAWGFGQAEGKAKSANSFTELMEYLRE
jgi:phosphoglycolate phosphatase